MKRIMFKDRYGLTQAVLDGRKTMTRRIIPLCENDLNFLKVADRGEWLFSSRTCLDGAYPAYKVGEEAWVAQSYKDLGYEPDDWVENAEGGYQQAHEFAGYTNKMFVRSLYLTHRIRITGIRAERLQDISDEDCLREGVVKWMHCYIVSGIMENQGKNNVCFDAPREAFAALIDRISGKGTWNDNPWVWVYTFEMIR